MLELCISLLFALPIPAQPAPAQPAARDHVAKVRTRTPTLSRLMTRFGTSIRLTASEQRRLEKTTKAAAAAQDDRALELWSSFENRYRKAHPKVTSQTTEALLARVIRGAFFVGDPKLEALANEAEFYNRQRQALQGEASALRRTQAGRKSTERVAFAPVQLSKYALDTKPTAPGVASTRTVKDWKAHLSHVDKQIAALDEESERLGNMEIQNLMARYNQAEALAAAIFKKSEDSDTSVINKI